VLLPYQVTEEKLREHFNSCGEIKEVNILKKPNGKLVGCAFIQFATVPQAAKAVRELNLTPFLGSLLHNHKYLVYETIVLIILNIFFHIGREVAIDWAIPKKDFQVKGGNPESNENATDRKDEIIKVKEEPVENEQEFTNPYDSIETDIKIEDEKNENSRRKRKFKGEDEDSKESYVLHLPFLYSVW
jgi:nucleolar protein 4